MKNSEKNKEIVFTVKTESQEDFFTRGKRIAMLLDKGESILKIELAFTEPVINYPRRDVSELVGKVKINEDYNYKKHRINSRKD